MSLERHIQQPVSYFRFSHHYTKLDLECGTTIRMSLKDDKGYQKKVGDLVYMIHNQNRFIARIEKIEKKKILDIPFDTLQQDVAPFKIRNHLDFLKMLQSFYRFPLTLDMRFYVIWWKRVYIEGSNPERNEQEE